MLTFRLLLQEILKEQRTEALKLYIIAYKNECFFADAYYLHTVSFDTVSHSCFSQFPLLLGFVKKAQTVSVSENERI